MGFRHRPSHRSRYGKIALSTERHRWRRRPHPVQHGLCRGSLSRNHNDFRCWSGYVGENSGIGITARDIQAYSTEAQAFSSSGAFAGASFVLSDGPSPESLPAARLTSGVLPTVGVEPLLGRVFSRLEEDTRAQVAVISYPLWTNRYHRRNSHARARGPPSSRIRGSSRARRPFECHPSGHCPGRAALQSQRRIARFSLCRDRNPHYFTLAHGIDAAY